MAAPFRVKALFEYTSPHEDDLNFTIGQVIAVTDEDDPEWYGGEYVDDDGVKKEGIFPRNFVEKFEPTPPPRPTRTRTKKADDAPAQQQPEPEQSAPAPASASVATPRAPAAPPPAAKDEPESELEPEVEAAKSPEPKLPTVSVPVPAPAAAMAPKAPAPKTEQPPKPAPREEPAAAPAPVPKSKPSGPPPVAEKPSSFKDRIAAFNKPAAAPVAPFKPGSLSGSSFIKKPFVPPPPSRDAYVPIPREQTAQKIYRRSEDPEIREQETQNQEQAEKAGLIPAETKQEAADEEEEQPKPTSLKERIALLAKQQQEQAQRHADAAAKREKPKKPIKKKPETPVAEPTEGADDADFVPLERKDTETTIGRTSLEEQAPVQAPPPPRRKVSRGPAAEFPHDGNEADMSGAGDTTEGQDDTSEREDVEEDSKRRAQEVAPTSPSLSRVPTAQDDIRKVTEEARGEDKEEEEAEEEVEEEEDDVDPEVRRKEELRARMAKMSGGMGFHGMFGAPMPPGAGGGLPKRSKTEQAPKEDMESRADESQRSAPPVPTPMALPGLGGPRKSQDREAEREENDAPVSSLPSPPPVPRRAPAVPETDDVDAEQEESDDHDVTPGPSSRSEAPRAPPPVPGGRPAPPPVPSEPPRPPVPVAAPDIKSPTEGSESDDELSAGREQSDAGLAQSPRFPVRSPPLSPRHEEPPSANKRNSRPPPPIPGVAPMLPPAAGRPPPPPPPGGLSRRSTADVPPIPPSRPVLAGEEAGEESTEYEGDYDTDIASSAPHKDALKAHARDSSVDDSLLQSPTTEIPQSRPPPIPPNSPPRAVPPPAPPVASLENKRRSVDAPRAAPPPPPPPAGPSSEAYDPYNYASPTTGAGSSKTPKIEEEAYFADTAASPAATPTTERRPLPPAGARTGGRQSMEGTRTSTSNRRSVDLHRPSFEPGFIANDVDLGVQSGWWKQVNQLPPVLQGRRDIFFESEESTTNNQGAKTIITREIFILYQDYSQTVISVHYDPYDPADVELDQKHEGPPRTLRQDEMEEFHDRFGRHILEAATAKKDTVVGDGSPQGLILELLRPLNGALWPVGTRAYGALHDVIRPGDIVSFRNSRFQGKHGAMHAKYSAEVGKPDHVAIVAEWDGTKKKLRAWEQGRENKKVKMESYKLDDLRSGEVKVWRIVARNWVGWNSQP
ncbi:hypothetical protein LLEC1_05670 [Akanthomyces lecanii]|uniref:SH3 domain-containing protein n=1 Tax=Cordyceps confragosa TaxID=2714763 RepID=A0A179I550_CORDF|nr:hypothetical protein LLEC1_05670 [Akanthomyces lecanii]